MGLVVTCSIAGCASPGTVAGRPTELADHLCQLSPEVERSEAALAADTACSYSLELAREYRVVRPAIFHNVLVNLGIRKRGLCFQWADDLSSKLENLRLHSLILHRGVARLGTRREHSSVVLTAPRQPFERGIVLDAWRRSGHLVWARVKEDKYPWTEVDVLPDVEPQSSAHLQNNH